MLINLHIVHGCFLATMAEGSSCYKAHMTYTTQNIYDLALYRKSLVTTVQQRTVQIFQLGLSA